MTDVLYEREQARQDAWYARAGLRRRLEAHPVEVEDRSTRWQQKAEETAAAREAEKDRRRHVVEQQRREERQREVALARVTGSADADVLSVIGQALNDVVDRIEKIEDRFDDVEARLGRLEGSNDGRRFAARLDALSARDEKSGRKMSTIERRADQEHELVQPPTYAK